MTVGDREFLTAELTPQNADNQSVTWSSSDAAIATVDERGEVNALAAGRSTIGVRTLDGDFRAACTVTVRAAGDPGSDDPENPDPNDPENPDPDNPGDPENPNPDDPDDDPDNSDDPDDNPDDAENPDDPNPENPGDTENPNPGDPILSGVVGSLSWSLDSASGTLTISGSGDLPDWAAPPSTRNHASANGGEGGVGWSRAENVGGAGGGELGRTLGAGTRVGVQAGGWSRAENGGGMDEVPPWSAVRERIATLVLPATIGRIGANNFAGCANLKTVEIAATTPPELDSANFNVQYYDTLVVPKSSFDLYHSHPAWYEAFSTFVGRE